MRKRLLAFCIVVMGALLGQGDLRDAMDAVKANVNRKTLRIFTIGEIGGQHICLHPSYRALAAMVSNDWENVVGNIGTIATNQTERYLLLGTGFQYGWDFHLPFFNKLVDECLAGKITQREVEWFESYSTKPGLVDQLYYRNTDPDVTNLLHKLIRMDGDTNRWMTIMSQDATNRVREYIDAGILYIPE